MLNKEIVSDLTKINKDLEDPQNGSKVFFEKHTEHLMELTKDFNLINSWWLAEFSRIAYVTNREKIISEMKEIGMEVEFFYNVNTEAHIAWDKDKIIVFFRGTEPGTYGDVHADVCFLKEDSETIGEVHHGFKEALDDVYEDLVTFYKAKKENRTVFITGHSLGAALATLFASRIREGILYTYGSPRVGGKHFARYMDSNLNDIYNYRCVNNADIVPHVPPVFVGFRHCGELNQLNKDGKFFGKPSLAQKFATHIKGLGLIHIGSLLCWLSRAILRKSLASRVADHNMLNYSGSIRKKVFEHYSLKGTFLK